LATRASVALGAGHPNAARRASRVGVGLGVGGQALLALTIFCAAPSVPAFFSIDDAESRALVVLTLRIVAVCCCGDAWLCCLGGLLRAVNRASAGVAAVTVLYLGVGVPAAALLAFPGRGWGLGAPGLWAGLALASNLSCPLTLAALWRIDWPGEAKRARLAARRERSARWTRVDMKRRSETAERARSRSRPPTAATMGGAITWGCATGGGTTGDGAMRGGEIGGGAAQRSRSQSRPPPRRAPRGS